MRCPDPPWKVKGEAPAGSWEMSLAPDELRQSRLMEQRAWVSASSLFSELSSFITTQRTRESRKYFSVLSLFLLHFFFSHSSFSPTFQTGCKFICKVIFVKCVWNAYENLSILKRRNLCMFGQCRNCKVEGGKTDEAAHACLFIQSRAIFPSCLW